MSAFNEKRKFRDRTKPPAVKMRAMIRRFIVTAAEKALWQIATSTASDDEQETDVEVFSGIGMYARPKIDSDPEVIMVKVGGKTAHPVIIASRDETTRQAVADILADETIIFNSTGARVIVTKDKEVLADDGSGAIPLATKADVDALQIAIDTHIHLTTAVTGGGGPLGVISAPTAGMPTAAGTSVFKAK